MVGAVNDAQVDIRIGVRSEHPLNEGARAIEGGEGIRIAVKDEHGGLDPLCASQGLVALEDHGCGGEERGAACVAQGVGVEGLLDAWISRKGRRGTRLTRRRDDQPGCEAR